MHAWFGYKPRSDHGWGNVEKVTTYDCLKCIKKNSETNVSGVYPVNLSMSHLGSLSTDLEMLLDETPLFEPSLLYELDWNTSTVSFTPPISPSSPGQDLVLRPLCLADFNRGSVHPI